MNKIQESWLKFLILTKLKVRPQTTSRTVVSFTVRELDHHLETISYVKYQMLGHSKETQQRASRIVKPFTGRDDDRERD